MKLIQDYLADADKYPLFLNGDSLEILKSFPDESIDCCITSPPYWGKRQYENGGIGLEAKFNEYIDNLFAIIKEVKRVLKKTGSFWLNIVDSYKNKTLLGIPWRVALKMMDDGWILRNDVIWYKHAGISTLLGLNSKANIQFEKIAKILESKISDSTVFNIGE